MKIIVYPHWVNLKTKLKKIQIISSKEFIKQKTIIKLLSVIIT